VSSTALYLQCGGTNVRLARDGVAPDDEETSVIGKRYFTRQAATLLQFARSTSDPKVASALIEKAADLKSRSDEETPLSEVTSLAPDIEPPSAI
jgi:hypothetical protein